MRTYLRRQSEREWTLVSYRTQTIMTTRVEYCVTTLACVELYYLY